jgi:hypothetical protein
MMRRRSDLEKLKSSFAADDEVCEGASHVAGYREVFQPGRT